MPSSNMPRLTCQSLPFINNRVFMLWLLSSWESDATLTWFGSISRSAMSQQQVMNIKIKKKKKEYSSWLAARVSEQEKKYCSLVILSVHPSTARIFLDSLIRGGTQDRSGYKSDFLFFNKYWFLQLSYCKSTTLVMLDAVTNELEAASSLNTTEVHSWLG